ncbi:MAG: Gldg family protein [Victivallales bacterium]|nr:Gldg family protein [Victivallales bacterium]
MQISFRQIKNIFIRETIVYFTTPPAYVFIVIFLLLSGFFTFATKPFGDLLNSNNTSLCNSFFIYHPWLFLILIPSIGMRLWSEEKKSGTIELLFTMPISFFDAVLGKYLSALFITLIALLLTFPIPLTVNWLGSPDNNIILCGYVASFLLAGSYLAITEFFSAITKNQIISLIISFVVCLLLVFVGHPSVTDFFIKWAPVWLTGFLSRLSVFSHYDLLQKGVIDINDILFFLSIIVFGLIGTCLVLKNKKVITGVKIILILIIIISINVISASLFTARYDLTQDRLFTLSEGTKNILKNLKFPVTVRFYCSYKDNRLPVQLRGYAGRINDLLKEYSIISNGKVRVEKIDPLPDSDYETSAVIDGVTGKLLKDGKKCYFGIAFSCMDKNAVIPFLNPNSEKNVEYKITRAIYDVVNFKKPKIGILSSLPVMGGFSGVVRLERSKKIPWIFVQELQKNFNVEKLDYDSDCIDEDIDVLLVFHPNNLSAATELAIDRYILKGGNMLAFTDSYCISESILSMNKYVPGGETSPTSSDLKKLFNAWGIKFTRKDDVVISPQNSYKPQTFKEKEHPAVLELSGPEYLNPKSIVTGNLNKVDLIFTGAFSGKPVKGLKKEVLIKTNKYSDIFSGFNFNTGTGYLMRNFKPDNKCKEVVIKLSGSFPTAFPEKNKNLDEDTKNLLKSVKPSTVILVGDADMLFNSFCVAKNEIRGRSILNLINSNISFLLNAADQLSGSRDIIKIRTRGAKKRDFVKLEKIFKAAKKKYRRQISVLEQQLQETKQYIKKIQENQVEDKQVKLSDSQINTIRKYRIKERNTAKKLKELRKLLRENLRQIKFNIQLIDIAGPAGLVVVIGLIICIFRFRSYNRKD